jgi:hypothetical protein
MADRVADPNRKDRRRQLSRPVGRAAQPNPFVRRRAKPTLSESGAVPRLG